jgi:hypothetical protein
MTKMCARIWGMLALFVSLAAAGVACQGAEADDPSATDTDTDIDTDTDTDTDSDTDTGTDTDSDSDSDVDEPGVDDDSDGYTDEEDCNDLDPNVNPDAIEVVIDEPLEDGGVPEPADEDCDGVIDNPPDPFCDEELTLTDVDPFQGARAIELCKLASVDGTDYGVVTAAYVRANGVAATLPTAQIGIQTNFGSHVLPLNGYNLLGLSSGHVRTPGQPDAANSQACSGYGAGTPPLGFPQDVPGCSGGTNINDDVGLELHLRAPSNAVGYRFKFRFYSFEYPEYVCTTFNDQFIALVDPPPDGSINGNISFDSLGNPVSVNIAFFTTCSGCPDGVEDLADTGFDGSWGGDAGATAWLQSTAPIAGGEEFTIRFAIWDTGDQILDSTALIDDFEWIATGGTPAVETEPIIE